MSIQVKTNNQNYLFGILVALALIVSIIPTLAFAGDNASSVTKSISFGNTIDNQTLKYKVSQVLRSQIPDSNFAVATYQNEVLITGQVATTDDKVKAGKSITEVSGISKTWNYLSVRANETPQDVAKDAYLTTAVKERLLTQNGINSNNIKVVTSARVVYLLGHKAGKSFQVRAAVDKIKRISDVIDVVNLIDK